MKTKITLMKNLLLIVFILTTLYTVNAQTVLNTDWVRSYSEKDSVSNIPAAIDANGNVYVTGYTYNIAHNYDYTTIKYNQLGDTLWVRHYNGPANSSDIASAIALDIAGNVYVSGGSYGVGSGMDYATVKYDQNGNQLWVARYNGTGNNYDIANSLAVDGTGNVFVVGSSFGPTSSEDFVTVKYNSNGQQQWVNRYNGTGNEFDSGIGIVVSSTGRVFATGTTTVTGGQKKIVSIRYNPNNGNTFWTKVYHGTFNGNDVSNDLISDGNNVIICGSYQSTANLNNYFLIKYNGNGGPTAFVKTYDAYGQNNVATSLTFDNNSNIVVTGGSQNTAGNWENHTIKYNPTGTQLWLAKYNSMMPYIKKSKVAVDPYNMVYVCGTMHNGANTDFLLLQYTATGNQVWYKTYNGTANGYDAATDMVVDNMGRIFVTGETFNGNAKLDYTTVKYSQSFVYHPPDFNNESAPTSFLFYENKGQLINTDGNLIPEEKYYTNTSYPSLYFNKTGLSYVFARIDTNIATPDTLHRIDMELLKSNSLTETFPVDTGQGFLNYYLGHCPQGVTDVKGYQRLFVPNIYPNIDLHYYANTMGLKYYFVIKPGGNPKDIFIRYNGADGISIDGTGNLHVKSSIGEVVMEKPSVYQVDLAQNIIPVSFTADWLQSDANTVHFNGGAYDVSKALVIQVDEGHSVQTNILNISWSTYLGGSKEDFAVDVTTDDANNVYVVGSTTSSNFPYNIGAVTSVAQANFGSYRDAFVTKFDNQAYLAWTTYYGGSTVVVNSTTFSPDDNGLGIVHDNLGRVLFTGLTFCSDFPTQSYGNRYYQSYLGGERDAFIVQLNGDGGLMWATYFGGNTREAAHSILRDNSGNIYICGSVADHEIVPPYNPIVIGDNGCLPPTPPTYNGGFPVCNSNGLSYYHSTHSGGGYNGFDAFIAKFDDNGLSWNTFFGGSGEDVARDIIIDTYDNSIYITGYTQSNVIGNNTTVSPCNAPTDNGFPLCDLGGISYYQSTYPGGSQNAFISKFNSQNKLEWSTFFGGVDENFGSHLVMDSQRNLYLSGIAHALTTFTLPLTNEYCDVPSNGGFPLCNPGNNAYYRDNNGTSVDYEIFLTKFNLSKQITWSTFFGGSGDDYNGSSFPENANAGLAIDVNDNVYLTGCTQKISGTTGDLYIYPYTGYYNQANNVGTGATRDAFLAVFNKYSQPVWSTYFGGGGSGSSALDKGSAIAISNDNKLYLVGGTSSTTFPTACPIAPNPYCQPGGLSNSGSGYLDAFITRFEIPELTNIENINSETNSFLIYPNPTTETTTLSFNLNSRNDIVISIFNNIGQLVEMISLKNKIGSFKYNINLLNLPDGIYLIQAAIGTNRINNKIIKAH